MTSLFSRAATIDGAVEITTNNFSEFFEFSGFFASSMGLYFRGQRDSSWKLATTLDRFSRTLDQRCTGTYDLLLNNFTRSVRGKTQTRKDQGANEDEIWALGQHYGLPTPLLDWTSAAFIALFFAFEEKIQSSTGYRTVWALHRFVAEEMEKYNKDKDKHAEFKFVDPITDHNNRLISQSGIFTKHPLNFDLEKWVAERFKGEAKKPVLFKVNIPDAERDLILKNLMLMNINHMSIYPDLTGAAKFCKLELEMISHKSAQMNDVELVQHANYTR